MGRKDAGMDTNLDSSSTGDPARFLGLGALKDNLRALPEQPRGPHGLLEVPESLRR
jgi:hypothetical protein